MKKVILKSAWNCVSIILTLLILLLNTPAGSAQPYQATSQTFKIDVDINQSVGEMYPMWAYFGYDEPNYTYMADGRKLISELADLSPAPVYYRAHNLLNTDEGPRAALKWGSSNAYTEDEQGNPVYDWTIIDKIFDTYIDSGGKPLVEIGFMPKALTTQPEPYGHNWSPDPNSQAPNSNTIHTGIHYPPKDYDKWAELIYQWVLHSVDRYGQKEVESWWWEVWNEPDGGWWMGTTEEFYKLYDYTVDAVKRALPTARAGGSAIHTSGRSAQAGQYFEDFLEHCRSGTNYVSGEVGSTLDFISFHAKGRPKVVDEGDHIQMSMSQEMKELIPGFELITSFPEFRDLPVLITEVDPEGCAACPVEFFPQNTYRNGTMFSSYTASSFARIYTLADEYKINLKGALSWAFVFEDQPWFSGFRALATNGVDKPVLNVFRMFGMMGGDRVAVTQAGHMTAQDIMELGVHGETPDVHALASRDDKEAMVMVWNYHDDDVAGPDAEVKLTIAGIPTERALVRHYRIDDHHSNSYTVWQEMGAPQQVTREQYKKLEVSGQLELLSSPKWVDVTNGKAPVAFYLPRQGVSLLQVTW